MQTAVRVRSPTAPRPRVTPLRTSSLMGVTQPPSTPVRRSVSGVSRSPVSRKGVPSLATPIRLSSPTGISSSAVGRVGSPQIFQSPDLEDEVRVEGDGWDVDGDRSIVGGAVGLWKLSREVSGNSPARQRQIPSNDRILASTPLVRGIRDAARAASEAPCQSTAGGPHNATVNSSFDTARMGSILRPPPTAPASAHRNVDGLTPTNRVSQVTSVGKPRRSSTQMTAPRGLLIPPLELPVYTVKTTTSTENGETTEHRTCQPGWISVVFDLDETLCNNRRMGKAALRPGCMELLRRLAQIRDNPEANCFVEIILWTASMECVARPVTDSIDPSGTLFNHLIFRDRRWYKEVGYTKDLRLLGRDLSHVVIVENSPQSVVLNRKHALLVKDYVGHGPNAQTVGGYSSFLGRYFSGDSATATASPTDPSLFIVANILCDWARAVGESSKAVPQHNPIATGFNHTSSTIDPGSIPLPLKLGIVEFLRERRDINHSNEIIIDNSNRHLGGDAVKPTTPIRASSSPGQGMGRSGYAVGRWRRGM